MKIITVKRPSEIKRNLKEGKLKLSKEEKKVVRGLVTLGYASTLCVATGAMLPIASNAAMVAMGPMSVVSVPTAVASAKALTTTVLTTSNGIIALDGAVRATVGALEKDKGQVLESLKDTGVKALTLNGSLAIFKFVGKLFSGI